MREIIGRLRKLARPEAPRHDLQITFRVLPSVPNEPAPAVSRLRGMRKEAEQGNPIEYLKACQSEARRLSRCTLSLAKRFPLMEEFAGYFLAVAFKQIRKYANDGGVPDPELRREILELIIETVTLLTESYKAVFKNSYLGGGHALFVSTRHVELSAFRILELVRLQQRVRGLRYEQLPDSAWLVVNTVFHVMHAAGEAETPIAMLEGIALEESVPGTQTMREAYLSIQMIAKFNVLRWPTEWQAYLFAYGKAVGTVVQMAEDDGSELPRDTAIAYCYGSGPAQTRRAAGDAKLGPASLINWSRLVNQVTNQFLLLFGDNNQGDRTKIPRDLVALPYNEALAFVQLQIESATTDGRPRAVDNGPGVACDMRIFIGFKSVYQLLNSVQSGAFAPGTRLVDVLAKRSAVLAEDQQATTESVWYLLYQDDKMIRLKTQETRFTTRMKIGLLAAYGVGIEGISKPRFGVISRLFRSSASTVMVDILKLGEYLEPVVVSSELGAFAGEDTKAGMVLGAIVVRDGMSETKLLLPPVSRPGGQNQLVMKRAGGRQMITLGKLQSVTKDLFLFRFQIVPPAAPGG